MQKIIYTFLFCVLSFVGFAQNLVFTFDDAEWQTSSCGNGQPNYDEPLPIDFFATLNKLCTIGIQPIITVSKSNDAHSGQSALLRTQVFGTANADSTAGTFSTLVPGLINSGKFNSSNLTNPLEQGQPYTQRPACISGWYKYMPINADSAAISVKLTNSHLLVGEASQVMLSAVPSWTFFSIDFTYYNTNNPDTINLVFVASAGGQAGDGYKGSRLWIDEVTIGTCINAISEEKAAFAQVFPNPAQGFIQVEWDKLEKPIQFSLFTIEGKKVKEALLFSPEKIDISDLPEGMYFYELINAENERMTAIMTVSCRCQ